MVAGKNSQTFYSNLEGESWGYSQSLTMSKDSKPEVNNVKRMG